VETFAAAWGTEVTLDTVKKHVSHVLDKLGAANRTQADDRARQLGLIR
jgi:DNA-binding NarL/FixJ family response regulator